MDKVKLRFRELRTGVFCDDSDLYVSDSGHVVRCYEAEDDAGALQKYYYDAPEYEAVPVVCTQRIYGPIGGVRNYHPPKQPPPAVFAASDDDLVWAVAFTKEKP